MYLVFYKFNKDHAKLPHLKKIKKKLYQIILRIGDSGLIRKMQVPIVGYTAIVTGSDLSCGIKLDDFHKNFICN